MYSVSQDYLDLVNSTNEIDKKVEIKIKTGNKTLTLTEMDLKDRGFSVKYGAVSGSEFGVGGVVAADLSLPLIDYSNTYDDFQLNHAQLIAKVGVVLLSGDIEWIPLGVFTIDTASNLIRNPGRPYNLINIKAMDNLVRLDIPFDDISIAFPCTAKQLLTALCQRCHLPTNVTSFLNQDYKILERPVGDYTCRDIVSSIAELACSYARCDRHGVLEFKWFKNPGYIQEANLDGGGFKNEHEDSADGGDFINWNTKTYSGGVFKETKPDIILNEENRIDFAIDDSPISITGLTLETEEQNYLLGSTRYAVSLSNPLIQHDFQNVLSSIYENLKGFTFMPFTSTRRDDPAMEAGDLVLHKDINGQDYRTIITEYEYVYRGRSKMAAVGASEIEHGFKSQSQKQYSRLLSKIGEKQVQLNALDDAIINGTQMLANAMGGRWINGDDIGYPGEIFVATNNDIHATATKVWRYNVNGYGFYPNGISGPATSGATADNSMWANLITANMIRTGLLQSNESYDDNGVIKPVSQINLDTGSFDLGKGALRFDGDTFEAVSAEKLTNKDSDGTYGTIGKGPEETDRYGLFVVNPTSGVFYQVYDNVSQWAPGIYSLYANDYVRFMKNINGNRIPFLQAYPGSTQIRWQNASGSTWSSVKAGSNGISFEVDGGSYGFDGVKYIGGTACTFKSGLFLY